MKAPLLLLVCLCLQTLSISQITFEAVSSPDDFCLSILRKSPIGEYFAQSETYDNAIYTSMDGQEWVETPFLKRHPIADLQFFDDGTPILLDTYEECLIRKDGSWTFLKWPDTGEMVKASFIKGDTLFVIANNKFGYSLDKGETFTLDFEYNETPLGKPLNFWKLSHHYVLFHRITKDHFNFFSMNGEKVYADSFYNNSFHFIYNQCGEIMKYNSNAYYLYQEGDFVVETGLFTDILPYDSDEFDIRVLSRNGYYYTKLDSTIYRTEGCNFNWQIVAQDVSVQRNKKFWIDQQEDILFYHTCKFYLGNTNYYTHYKSESEQWETMHFDIDYAYVNHIDEGILGHQFATTKSLYFTKDIHDILWEESVRIRSHPTRFTKDGSIYINDNNVEIKHTTDGGVTFTIIDPTYEGEQITVHTMYVIDDGILYIVDHGSSTPYYTINNGQDWIPIDDIFFLNSLSQLDLKLVDNYIYAVDLKYTYKVKRLNILTNEIDFEDIRPFYTIGFSTDAFITDEGIIYYYDRAVDIGGNPYGLHRYHYGEEPEFLGEFPELSLSSKTLFSSGPDLYAFGEEGYYRLEGETFTAYEYLGLPEFDEIRFFHAKNEHIYAIIGHDQIFRSTEPLTAKALITGTMYREDNCLQDTSAMPLKHWPLILEGDNNWNINMTDEEGNYFFAVSEGSYTISSQPINVAWSMCESSFDLSVDDSETIENQNFQAKALVECAHLEFDFSTPLLRRCFDNYYNVWVRNTGPSSSTGTTLTIQLDPYFTFDDANVSYTQINDSMVVFDLGVLEPNENISFKIFFNLSCEAELGKEHCLFGILRDEKICTFSDNSYKECQENLGSFDPNDKRIFNENGKQVNEMDKGEYIYYHIRFQNTGTDTAFTVRILDLLSPKLDVASLEVLSASHPYEYSITEVPALDVRFNNILLPDSTTNEPASHGYFKFKIKPLPEYDYGTAIANKAAIYFDFNEPIITNEAVVELKYPPVPEPAVGRIEFSIFPNPSSDKITLDITTEEYDRIEEYEVINSLGQSVNINKPLLDKKLNISYLSPGIYHLLFKEKGQIVGVEKFVKIE